MGMQMIMLKITEPFIENPGLKISINHIKPKKSKTKCLVFGLKNETATFVKYSGFNLP